MDNLTDLIFQYGKSKMVNLIGVISNKIQKKIFPFNKEKVILKDCLVSLSLNEIKHITIDFEIENRTYYRIMFLAAKYSIYSHGEYIINFDDSIYTEVNPESSRKITVKKNLNSFEFERLSIKQNVIKDLDFLVDVKFFAINRFGMLDIEKRIINPNVRG